MSLKILTSEKHRFVEKMLFNQKMIGGELTKEEYLKYLTQVYNIFSTIERKIHLPENLIRTRNVLLDIYELDLNHDFKVLKSTEEYMSYLDKHEDHEVWPHVYLNYMAFMFGGQLIKTKIPGSGRVYDFENIQESIGFIRTMQIDEWADEVNKGFDFLISIYDELQRED